MVPQPLKRQNPMNDAIPPDKGQKRTNGTKQILDKDDHP
jgi:hypothetical protein